MSCIPLQIQITYYKIAKTQAKIVINIAEDNSKITTTVICRNKFVEAMVLHNVPNAITLYTSHIFK